MKNLFRIFTKVSLTKKYLPEDDSPLTDGGEAGLRTLSLSIEKRLVGKDLASLDTALGSRGGVATDCVLYPSHDHGERPLNETPPQVVLFRVFRHPKVQNSSDLKRLPCCTHTYEDSRKVCINPYHYSAVLVANRDAVISESMCSKHSSNDKPAGKSSSGFISNWHGTSCSNERSRTRSAHPSSGCFTQDLMLERKRRDSWCSIAYWEQSKRVGAFYEGIADVINVFESLPVADGFCLATLDRLSEASDKTKQILARIGYGLQLSRELDGIWLYNRSEHALFANGSTLNHRSRPRNNFPVTKIPPGFSLKVYDFFSSSSPVPATVRISFMKGWGKDYKRPYVTCCPCWIEVHFSMGKK